MKSSIRSARRVRIIAFILIMLCLLTTVIYASRAWLRQSIVPFYASTVYMHQIHTHYQKDFSPINVTLASFSYHFTNPDNNGCIDPMFGGFGESVGCIESSTSNKLKMPNTQLIQSWRRRSVSLERQALAAGWKKDNIQQPIATLLDDIDVNDTSQPAVTYHRYYGKIECGFSIINSPSSYETYAIEGCNRSVDFFGGY